MIVEMGNQMKDLHTLLHYLPIIRTSSNWNIVDCSMGSCFDIDCISAKSALREHLQHTAMGETWSLLPQCAKFASAITQQFRGKYHHKAIGLGTK